MFKSKENPAQEAKYQKAGNAKTVEQRMEFEKSISIIMIVAFLIVIFVEFVIGHVPQDDED